jgi:hypothetical protein
MANLASVGAQLHVLGAAEDQPVCGAQLDRLCPTHTRHMTAPLGAPAAHRTCSLSSVSTPCRITRARPQSSSISKVREHTLVQLRHPMHVNSSTNTCAEGQG